MNFSVETEIAVDWQQILEESFRELVETMLPIEIQSVQRDWSHDFCPDLAAEIGFHGDVAGSLGLFLPWNAAHALTNLLQGVDVPPDPEEIRDVAGEVANLIAGGLKQRIRETNGLAVEIAVPRVQANPNLAEASDKGKDRYRLLFRTNVGMIGVRVFLKGSGKAR